MTQIKKTTIIKIGEEAVVVSDLPENLQRAVEQYDNARERTLQLFVNLSLADNAIEAITAKISAAIQSHSDQEAAPETE